MAQNSTPAPIRIINLGSGSRGNATLLCHDTKILMIDCGFSRRQIFLRMAALGLDPGAVCGILLTHEHADHIKGARLCSWDMDAPILATRGTIDGGGLSANRVRRIRYDEQIEQDGFAITPLAVSHDGKEPCAFLVDVAGTRSLFITDIGTTEGFDIAPLGGLDFLYVEANHDEEMLKNGPYPYFLKNRIAGDGGHLNNVQSGQFIKSLAAKSPNLRAVMLAHLSDKNNDPGVAMETVRRHTDSMPDVGWHVAATIWGLLFAEDQGYCRSRC